MPCARPLRISRHRNGSRRKLAVCRRLPCRADAGSYFREEGADVGACAPLQNLPTLSTSSAMKVALRQLPALMRIRVHVAGGKSGCYGPKELSSIGLLCRLLVMVGWCKRMCLCGAGLQQRKQLLYAAVDCLFACHCLQLPPPNRNHEK